MTPRQQQFLAAIPASWKEPLKDVCQRPEIDALVQFLQEREAAGAVIFPQKKNIFAALQATPFDAASVVIVGQDPYHGPEQAHGLSFSVLPGITQPPSLRNILLLNALLTVEKNNPASHAGKGWELFTDAIIAALIKRNKPMVFMLWGAYAQKKVAHLDLHINPSLHLILKAAHPSPFSVTKFLGCSHFSKANVFLKHHNLPEIDWAIE